MGLTHGVEDTTVLQPRPLMMILPEQYIVLLLSIRGFSLSFPHFGCPVSVDQMSRFQTDALSSLKVSIFVLLLLLTFSHSFVIAPLVHNAFPDIFSHPYSQTI